MHIFLFLYFLVFPFGQLLSVQLLPSARVHLADLIILIFVAFYIAEVLWKRKVASVALARPLLSFLGFSTFALFVGSVGLPFENIAVGFSYLARLALYIFFYIGASQFLSQEQKHKLYDCLLVVGTFIALGGLLGYFLFPDTRALSEFGWDNHYYRLIGSFLDPAFTGILLVLFIILVVCRSWKGVNGKFIGFVLFSLGWTALALTYSRASFVGLAIALFTLFLVHRNIKLLVAGIILGIGTLFLLPHPQQSAGTNLARTQTISGRFTNYEEALHVGLKNPVSGVGYNFYGRPLQGETLYSSNKITHTGSGVHSSLLFVFATTGIGGLLIYIALWWKILGLGMSARKTTFGIVLLCSTSALLAESLFDNSLFYPWVMGWMAILLAVQEER